MIISSKNIISLVSLLFMVLLLMVPESANAHVFKYCEGNRPLKWKTNFMQLQIQKFHFAENPNPRAPDNLRQALLDAIAAWNQAPGVDFRIGFNYRDTVSTRKDLTLVDNINSVSINTYPGMKDNYAFSTKRWRCGREGLIVGSVLHFIDETDIFFNPSYEFTNAPIQDISESKTTTGLNLGVIAVHEIGHSMGLAHDDNKIQSMNTLYPDGGPLGMNGFGIDSIKPHAEDLRTARKIYPGGNDLGTLEISNYEMSLGDGTGPSATQIALPAQIRQNDLISLTPILVTIENRGGSGTFGKKRAKIEFYLTDTPAIRNVDGTVTYGPKVHKLYARDNVHFMPDFSTSTFVTRVLFDVPVGVYHLVASVTNIASGTPGPIKEILLGGVSANGQFEITPYPQNLLIPAFSYLECNETYAFINPQGQNSPGYINCMRNAVASKSIYDIGRSTNWIIKGTATLKLISNPDLQPDRVEYLIVPVGGAFADATLIDSPTNFIVELINYWREPRETKTFEVTFDTTLFPDGEYTEYATGYVGNSATTLIKRIIIDNTAPIVTLAREIGGNRDKDWVQFRGNWYENNAIAKDTKFYYNNVAIFASNLSNQSGSPLRPAREISGTWNSRQPAYRPAPPIFGGGQFEQPVNDRGQPVEQRYIPLPLGTVKLTDAAGNTCTIVTPRRSAGNYKGEEIICN